MTNQPRRPLGRPRSSDLTHAVCFKLPQSIYDEYCRASLITNVPVRVLMRRVLADQLKGVHRLNPNDPD